MSTYPTLASSALSQRPYTRSEQYLHCNNDMACGARFSYLKRDAPLHKFVLTYSGITDADLATLEAFWVSVNGSYGSFDFVDLEGTTYHNCRFENDSFDMKYLSPNQNSVTLAVVEQGYVS